MAKEHPVNAGLKPRWQLALAVDRTMSEHDIMCLSTHAHDERRFSVGSNLVNVVAVAHIILPHALQAVILVFLFDITIELVELHDTARQAGFPDTMSDFGRQKRKFVKFSPYFVIKRWHSYNLRVSLLDAKGAGVRVGIPLAFIWA